MIVNNTRFQGISPYAPTATVATMPVVFRATKAVSLFDNLTLDQAQAVVTSRKDANADINIAFYNGDHWQGGAAWTGPSLSANTNPLSDATMAAIQKSFVSRNAISEITGRHVAGVLGREIHWKLTVARPLPMIKVVDKLTGKEREERALPSDEEQALIDEAEALLVKWLNKRGVARIMQSMVAAFLNTKRAVMRVYVPPDLRDDDGNLPPGDMEQTIDYIYPQHLGHNDDKLVLQFPFATVYTQKSSQRQVGVYTYKEVDEFAELMGAEATEEERAELTYLDEAGMTVLRVINKEGNVEDPVTMPLGGRLTMFEATRPWLVTPQIVSLQKLLNMSLTMMQRNAVVAGFLERVFSNVDWPGKWVDDPSEPAGKRFVPDELVIGPNVNTHIRGIKIKDKDNNTSFATPEINYRDPVSPQTFVDTQAYTYTSILQESNQLHYAQVGGTVVSGESRKQAREAFKQDLQMSASLVEEVMRWLLELVLAMASYFAGRAGAFEGLRVYAQCRINTGPISPEDMRAAKEMKEATLWSRETAQSETGIEDVDAENARIAKEQAELAESEAANLKAAQRMLDANEPDEEPVTEKELA